MYLYDDDELNCTHTLIGSYDLLVHTYDLLEDRGINDITINIFFIFDHIKQIEFMLLFICLVIDHRRLKM